MGNFKFAPPPSGPGVKDSEPKKKGGQPNTPELLPRDAQPIPLGSARYTAAIFRLFFMSDSMARFDTPTLSACNQTTLSGPSSRLSGEVGQLR